MAGQQATPGGQVGGGGSSPSSDFLSPSSASRVTNAAEGAQRSLLSLVSSTTDAEEEEEDEGSDGNIDGGDADGDEGGGAHHHKMKKTGDTSGTPTPSKNKIIVGAKSVSARQIAMNQSRFKFTIADDVRSRMASEGLRMFPPSLLNPFEETVVDSVFHCYTVSWPVQQYPEDELRARERVIFNERIPTELENVRATAKAKLRRALFKIKMALSYFRHARETKKGKRLHLAALDFREWITVAAPSFAATVERDLVKWYEPLRDKDHVKDFN